MATVTPQDVADLIESILPDLDRMNWEQIATELQDYEMMSHWLKKDRVSFEDGIAIRKNLLARTGGAASHTGITDTDSSSIPDLMEHIQVPWRHAQTNWSYHYQTDILMNRGKARINDTVKPRRYAAMVDLAAELEEKAWQVPNTTDKLNPYGMPYWVVYNATTGFTGGYPTGPDAVAHTTLAGLDLTDAPNFKNYSANYTDVSKTDLLKKMRTGQRKTRFKSPVTRDDMSTPRGKDRRFYCNETTVSSLEDIGESQNENLGRDLAPFEAGVGQGHDITNAGGELTFRKIPIIWVPQLDDTNVFTACSNPIYQIDHAVFHPFCLKGDYLRETGPEKVPDQHNMWRVFLDLTYNFLCSNRRRCAVYATA